MKPTPAVRRTLLAMLSLFLVATGQSSFAAPAPDGAGAGDLKTFRVGDFEKVIIPGDAESHLGSTAHLNTDKSDSLRVGLGYSFISKISGSVSAVVGGIPQSIYAGEIFTRRNVKGGRIAELPDNALILCREPVQRNFGQAMASATTLGLTQLAARYAADIQLCAVDGDRDGNIEKLFLGGAKQQQDLDFTNIEPTPYDYRENFPVDGVALTLFAMKRIWGDVIFVASVERNGQRTELSQLRFESNGKMVNQKVVIPIKKGHFPQEVKFGSAVLLIKAYDATTGVIDLEFSKYFDMQKLDWYVAPQVIYIYY